MKDLKLKVEKFNSTISRIDSKRKQWQNQTKPLLVKVLGEIMDQVQLELLVLVTDTRINHESVNLQFKSKPSGISEKREKIVKAYIKWGGALNFSQAYNGEVHIVVNYPYVDEIVAQNKHTLLIRIEPDKITDEFIYARVNDFLGDMLNWELVTSGSSFGMVFPEV